MTYYFAKTLAEPFDQTVTRVLSKLEDNGFGVLTEIDVKATLKKKLDADIGRYTILGACNPGYAYKALQAEDKIGTMLPCNVIVRETEEGQTEVAAVDPIASMQAIENEKLSNIASAVRDSLRKVIDEV